MKEESGQGGRGRRRRTRCRNKKVAEDEEGGMEKGGLEEDEGGGRRDYRFFERVGRDSKLKIKTKSAKRRGKGRMKPED